MRLFPRFVALLIAVAGGCRVEEAGPRCPSGACPSSACENNSRRCRDCRCPRRSADGRSLGRRESGGEPIPYRTFALAETPVMNLPPGARQRNWGGGSCVHASTVMCLRWQGLDELADWWRRTYSGGEHASGLSDKLERAGVRFACTTNGDVAFLDWACRTRRGCGIAYFPNHFVCLVDLDRERAMLLDNNRIDRYLTVPRGEFVRRWRGYGGWACTPVYSPAPPPARR